MHVVQHLLLCFKKGRNSRPFHLTLHIPSQPRELVTSGDGSAVVILSLNCETEPNQQVRLLCPEL